MGAGVTGKLGRAWVGAYIAHLSGLDFSTFIQNPLLQNEWTRGEESFIFMGGGGGHRRQIWSKNWH